MNLADTASALADEQIRQEVMDHLFWDTRVDVADVTVEVRDGVVTLRGTVPTYLARTAAFEDAWSVLGVRGVRDNIHVRYPAGVSVPEDEAIQARVEDVLAASPDIDASEIDVAVNGGVVTLRGTVDALWKKHHTERLVAHERGVIDIENELAVVPTYDVADRGIAEAIVAALERHALIEAEDVNVTVEDGHVTLGGMVDTWAALQAARAVARYTRGVVDVHDELVIRARSRRA